VIPDAEAIVAGYPWIARRFRRVNHCNAEAVRAAVENARRLAAVDPAFEPAAVFYAFADMRRAFPFAWRLMAGYLAKNQARLARKRIRATTAELDAQCDGVLRGAGLRSHCSRRSRTTRRTSSARRPCSVPSLDALL